MPVDRILVLCGTDSSDGSGDILADTKKYLANPEIAVILPGPGGYGADAEGFTEAGPVYFEGKTYFPEDTPGFDILAELMGGLHGKKIIRWALEQIERDIKSGKNEFIIAGWSRGAYNAYVLMDLLKSKGVLDQIKVSMFLIDPVKQTDLLSWARPLPHVEPAELILAGQEWRNSIFPLYTPSAKSKETLVTPIILPGDHGSVARSSSECGKITEERYLLFLAKKGIKVVRPVGEEEHLGRVLNMYFNSDSPYNFSRLTAIQPPSEFGMAPPADGFQPHQHKLIEDFQKLQGLKRAYSNSKPAPWLSFEAWFSQENQDAWQRRQSMQEQTLKFNRDFEAITRRAQATNLMLPKMISYRTQMQPEPSTTFLRKSFVRTESSSSLIPDAAKAFRFLVKTATKK